MAYNVLTLKADLSGILHGTTLNEITNITGVINRSGHQVLLDIDPQETKRILPFANPIYGEIYDYALPVDVKGDRVIDIFPQVNRTPDERFNQDYAQSFDLAKGWTFQPNFNINFNNSIKTIRINAPWLNPGTILNNVDSIVGNGTWVAGSSASNLSVNNTNFYNNLSSLSFDLAALGSTGTLTNSTMTSLDISSQELQSALFFYTYLPTAANFSSVELRWGSSPTDYWSQVLTTTSENTAFQNGWNLMQANWNTATITGSPNASAVNYLQVIWTYNGTAMNGVLLSSIISKMGLILQIKYYSKYLFRDYLTNVFKENTTADTDIINLDTEAYNIMLYQTALQCVQQALGADAGYDTNYFESKYQDAIDKYQQMYRSEITKPRQIYYHKPNPSYNKYLGRQWR